MKGFSRDASLERVLKGRALYRLFTVDNDLVYAGEKIEDLGNGLRIIQNPEYFSFGTDAVLLADFAKMKEGERAVDLGTGCGIIPILMYSRNKGIHVTGIEIQEPLAEMAQRSVKLNGLEENISIIQGDLKEAPSLTAQGVDAVVANPPYEKIGSGQDSPNEYFNIAKREIMCSLDDVIRAAGRLLRTGGRFYVIYRTERFAELMDRMRANRIEPKRIMLVSQRRDEAPNFALVEGRKGAREGVKFLPTLAVYEKDGTYTSEAKRVYSINQ